MVEKHNYVEGAPYPGKASVIFYKNGPTVGLDAQGMPRLSSKNLEEDPYYMEAELNSPMVVLAPGETYAMDTAWFPSRMGRDFHTVTDAGLVGQPLLATRDAGNINLSGTFGVFFPGELEAHLYGRGGAEKGHVRLQSVNPQDEVELHHPIAAAQDVVRVSLHLVDRNDVDRGALGEVFVTTDNGGH
jgi:hypothetical protein